MTSLDETFMLFCIRVYCGNNTELSLEEGHEMKYYVVKTGWQEASTLMYDSFYHRFVDDYVENNNQFDKAFHTYIAELEKLHPMHKAKQCRTMISQACNNL